MLKSASKYVASLDYERYVPAQVALTSKRYTWTGLLLTRYRFPRQTHSSPRPATCDHILGVAESGAHRGEYSYASSGWRRFSCRQGDWIIQQAFENHGVDFRWKATCAEHVAVCSDLIHISPALLERAVLETCDRDPRYLELPHRISFRDSLMLALATTVKNEIAQGNPGGTLYVETIAQLLAVHLLQHYCASGYRIPEPGKNLAQRRLRQVIDYVHAHTQEDLSLNTLAELAHMSAFHFARLFKQTTGKAPHQYLIDCRIRRAQQLLRQTDWPVTRIAVESGYPDASTFSTVFKRRTGSAPSHYRKKLNGVAPRSSRD